MIKNMDHERGQSLNPFDLLTTQLNRIESILLHIKNLREDEFRNNILLKGGNGLAMAMRVTGLKKKSIYNLVNLRKIPHYKKGNRLYFDERELEAWKMSEKRNMVEEKFGSRRGL